MASVTINGHTYSDDSSPTTGLGGGGHRTRFIPLIQDVVAVIGDVASMGDVALVDAANTFTELQTIQISTVANALVVKNTNTGHRAEIALYGYATDASATAYGAVTFYDNALTSSEKRLALLMAYSDGSTALDRGGALAVFTKTNASTLVERMRVNQSGNVLINTTSDDSTGAKLQVNGDLNIRSGYQLTINGTQVVDARKTGWAAASGTPTRTTFATSTVTTTQLAERVKALIDDLISHGLIGT